VKAVGWENGFTCDGVADVQDFDAVVVELDTIESGSSALTYALADHISEPETRNVSPPAVRRKRSNRRSGPECAS